MAPAETWRDTCPHVVQCIDSDQCDSRLELPSEDLSDYPTPGEPFQWWECVALTPDGRILAIADGRGGTLWCRCDVHHHSPEAAARHLEQLRVGRLSKHYALGRPYPVARVTP